ncbi:hypothetical protein PAXINDRAFT_53527, partial [Paxillus involutus ATCC 200175]
MPNRKISPNVKLTAIRLHQQGLLSLWEILDCVGFARRTFFWVRKLYCETGDVVKPRGEFHGRPRTLNLNDLQYLIELVHHRPDWFLDELVGLMECNHFISVHYMTIHRELLRADVSLKKLHKITKEHNEDL